MGADLRRAVLAVAALIGLLVLVAVFSPRQANGSLDAPISPATEARQP